MKNKILFISLIIIIMAFISIFGYTNARYHSTASMTGNLDVKPIIDTIGQISIYNPHWVYGYDKETGFFNVQSIPIEFIHIHYSVTNKVDNKINEEQIEYYIRIVAEDGSDNIPIEYDVHEYSNGSNIYNKVAGVGYGPFTLKALVEETQYYSIRVNYVSHVADIQHLKVQMIKKESDNTLTVMSEAPLNMQYTGNKVSVNFEYYLYGTNPAQKIGASQTLNMSDNFVIDFTNEKLLNGLKISLPENYTFHDARSALNGWAESLSITIPVGNLKTYTIEVYMTLSDVVSIILNYYDYSSYTVDEATGIGTYSSIRDEVRVVVNRGITIDFTNLTQLNDLQIPMPDNYVLKGLGGALVTNQFVDKFVKIPSATTDSFYNINIYMQSMGNKVSVNFKYYLYATIPAQEIGASQTLNMSDNFVIDFTNEKLLNDLKISLPENYTFHDARSALNGWAESSSITIPAGNSQTYTIEVYMSSPDVVPIILNYYDYSSYRVDEATGNGIYSSIRDEVRVVVNRGITIDFTNLTQLNDLQIPMPNNYVLKGLDGVLITNKLVDKFVKIPSTTTDNFHYINIYMNPNGNATVNVSYYNWRIDKEYSGYFLSEYTIEVPTGTKIDFKDTESLTNLCIPKPDGYTLENAYCSSIDSTGKGSSEFTIPIDGGMSTYDIDVVLLGNTIKVPVKFYDSNGAIISSTTVDMEADGTYTFTTDVCRTLCPALGGMTSFTVAIHNGINTNDVGNTSVVGSVVIDCDAGYGVNEAYKLKNGGSHIYIKAWW